MLVGFVFAFLRLDFVFVKLILVLLELLFILLRLVSVILRFARRLWGLGRFVLDCEITGTLRLQIFGYILGLLLRLIDITVCGWLWWLSILTGTGRIRGLLLCSGLQLA